MTVSATKPWTSETQGSVDGGLGDLEAGLQVEGARPVAAGVDELGADLEALFQLGADDLEAGRDDLTLLPILGSFRWNCLMADR